MSYQNNSQYVSQPNQYAVNNYAQTNQTNNFQQYQSQIPKSEMATTTNLHLVLLGMADLFQRLNQFRLAIHSLESVLTMRFQDMPITTNLQIQLKTRINLCRLYLKHTINTNQYVNAHLEKSIILVQNLNANDELKYEATYLIYKIFQKQKEQHLMLKQQQQNGSQIDQSQLSSLFNIELIKHSLETSSAYPVWHMRLLFLIADILNKDKEHSKAASYLSFGIDYCAANRIPPYTHILFILCKGLVHLIQRNPNDLQLTMQPCASLIETCQTNNLNQIESLKVFFLVLQVTYFLQCGQMKSVRNTLKSLQHYIQSLTTREESDTNTGSTVLENFQWLPKDLLGLLAYLLTVIHSIQTGCFDKAIKFSEKALINIQKLKLKDEQMNLTITNKFKFITEKFNLLFFENQIRSNIALGNRSEAIKQIGDAFILCDQDPLLMNMYCAQLHCLLGIYASSINQREMALTHFNQALKTSTDSDMWLYCVMNLAVCYLNSMATHPNSKNQFFSIVDNVTPEKIQTQNTALNSLSHLFRALKLHLNSNQQQAQESLKEAILLANSEELSNVACNSFLLIGHISFSMNQFQECFNMLTNGVDLADKMSDLSLRIYGTSLLKDLYKYFNDPREAEMSMKYNDLEKARSNGTNEAVKMPQHALLNWNSNTSPKEILTTIKNFYQSTVLSNSSHLINQPVTQSNQNASASPNVHHQNQSVQGSIHQSHHQQHLNQINHSHAHQAQQQQQQHSPHQKTIHTQHHSPNVNHKLNSPNTGQNHAINQHHYQSPQQVQMQMFQQQHQYGQHSPNLNYNQLHQNLNQIQQQQNRQHQMMNHQLLSPQSQIHAHIVQPQQNLHQQQHHQLLLQQQYFQQQQQHMQNSNMKPSKH